MQKPNLASIDFSFWKNITLFVLFFTLTPIVLATSIFTLFTLNKAQKEIQKVAVATPNQIQAPSWGVRVYASLPSEFPSVSSQVTSADSRAELIRQYLASYNSPLTPYAPIIVHAADKYGLDFRLTTAIAQQESNLCKKIPPESYNCWGWGVHSRGTLGFDSYEEGIEIVSRGLRELYLDQGLISIDAIMGKYTPLSNGSWAYGVNKSMNKLR